MNLNILKFKTKFKTYVYLIYASIVKYFNIVQLKVKVTGHIIFVL